MKTAISEVQSVPEHLYVAGFEIEYGGIKNGSGFNEGGALLFPRSD